MGGKVYKNKCARRQEHDIDPEPVRKTKDHIVKRCIKCKGLFYNTRRTK